MERTRGENKWEGYQPRGQCWQRGPIKNAVSPQYPRSSGISLALFSPVAPAYGVGHGVEVNAAAGKWRVADLLSSLKDTYGGDSNSKNNVSKSIGRWQASGELRTIVEVIDIEHGKEEKMNCARFKILIVDQRPKLWYLILVELCSDAKLQSHHPISHKNDLSLIRITLGISEIMPKRVDSFSPHKHPPLPHYKPLEETPVECYYTLEHLYPHPALILCKQYQGPCIVWTLFRHRAPLIKHQIISPLFSTTSYYTPHTPTTEISNKTKDVYLIQNPNRYIAAYSPIVLEKVNTLSNLYTHRSRWTLFWLGTPD